MITGEAIANVSDIGPVLGNYMVNITTQLGSIGIWLQAIGVIVVLWLIFQIIAFILNLKKERKLKRMEASIERIETKIDKIAKKK